MKRSLHDLPYWEITFDKTGTLLGDTGLEVELAAAPVDDLFVFSHGWNSSAAGARAHYDRMFGQIADMAPGRSLGFVGVLWPALLFPQDDPAADGPILTDRADTQSMPLAVAGPPPAQAPVSSGEQIASALAPAFPGQEADLIKLGALLDSQPQNANELITFIELTRGLISTPNDAEEDRGEASVLTAAPRALLDGMAALAPPASSPIQSGGNPFTLLWRGGKELLRTASYYEMKNRAGVVGRDGLGPLIGRIAARPQRPRIHLIGHSFGARLVAFALAGLPQHMRAGTSPVKSLLLIQGAFSHFAFAPKAPVTAGTGALSTFGDRVDGPLLATFSRKDRAVGWWYPNASRLAWQDAETLRNPNFRWGGMGNDGFQQDGAQTIEMAPAGSTYSFEPRGFYRLDGNDVINRGRSWFAGAHSDIDKPQIAWAAACAARLS